MFGTYTIGVALITYNGEKYIEQQLESVRKQTIKADYVYIHDDNSTDGTYQVIQEYIEKKHLSGWKASQNERNLGWRANVIQALKSCDTDIIFWSDQDDIWYPYKIAYLLDVLLKSDSCLAAYSSWNYIDSESNRLSLHTGKESGKTFVISDIKVNSQFPPLLGCSACFKREALAHLDAILPCEYNSPDGILYRICFGIGLIAYIDMALFDRRIHKGNVTAPLSSLKTRWILSYEKCDKNLLVMKAQLETFQKINEYIFTTLGYYNYHLKNEESALKTRIDFLEGKEKFGIYIIHSWKDNSVSDFVYILSNDLYYLRKKTGLFSVFFNVK